MKKIALLFAFLCSAVAWAQYDSQDQILKTWYPYTPHQCSKVQLVEASRPGVIMRMTIHDEEATQLFREKFPYNDCYQGFCNYYQEKYNNWIVINFTNKMGNQYWGRGQAAEYLTIPTDNGTWISMTNSEGESVSWLWKGCYL